MKFAFFLTLALSAVSALAIPAPDGMTLCLPFEKSFAPSTARTAPTVSGKNAEFVPGRIGNAVIPNKICRFRLLDNLTRERGTVAFFIRFPWAETDGGAKRDFVLFRLSGHQIVYSQNNRRITYMAGETLPKRGWVWDYNCGGYESKIWRKNEFHHIAFTYDLAKETRELYLDGVRVGRKEKSLIPINFAPETEVTFGAPEGSGYDELLFFDRVLSPAEIMLLSRQNEPWNITAKTVGPVTTDPLDFPLTPLPKPVNGIVAPGELFSTTIRAENKQNSPLAAEVEFQMLDLRDRIISVRHRKLTLAPREIQTLKLEFAAPVQRGYYKLAASYHSGSGKKIKDVRCFAVWPDVSARPIDPESFFGNHVNSWGEDYPDLARRLGLGWVRGHDMLQSTWWNRIQPESGKFIWTSDLCFQRFSNRGMPVLGCLNGTPYWATAEDAGKKRLNYMGSNRPPNIGHWRNYVRAAVEHFGAKIKYWEIWNEPEVSLFWSGSPRQLAELTTVAAKEIHRIDPAARVMAAGFSYPAWEFQKQFASAGGLRELDILSIHYPVAAREFEVEKAELEPNIHHFRELWKQYGPAKRPFRLWISEAGYASTTAFRGLDAPGLIPERLRRPMDCRAAAYAMVRGTVLMQSFGVEKMFYYLFNPRALNNGSLFHTGMFDVDGSIRPKQLARAAMQELTDFTRFAGLLQPDRSGRTVMAVYQDRRNPDKSILVAWCGRGGSVKVEWNMPEKTVFFDLFANPLQKIPSLLSEEPIYASVPLPSKKLLERLSDAKFTLVRPPDALELPSTDSGHGIPPLPNFIAPAENPTGIFFVDLKKQCNMGFADEKGGDGKGGWCDEGPLNDFAVFPVGRQTFRAVPFEVINPSSNQGKSILVLRGKKLTPNFPSEIRIRVDRANVRALYFLHSAGWGLKGVIGNYKIIYADGTSVSFENRIPVNNGNWHETYVSGEHSRPVAIKVNHNFSGRPAWRFARVFEFQNPHVNRPIAEIVFQSAGGEQTPVLIAITGICW